MLRHFGLPGEVVRYEGGGDGQEEAEGAEQAENDDHEAIEIYKNPFILFFFIRLDRVFFFRDYANNIPRSARTSRTVHQSLNRSSINRFILFFSRYPRFRFSYFALL